MVVTRSQVKLPQESANLPAHSSSVDQTEPPSGEPPQVHSSQLGHGTGTHSISHSSRSSAIVAARKAAAEAEHVRRVAQLETAEMEAEMRARAQRTEIERRVAQAEYQAQLAAIEADSQHGSRSGRSHASVEQWVDSAAASIKTPSHPDPGLQTRNECEVGLTHKVICSQDALHHDVVISHPQSIAAQCPTQLPQHNFSRGDRAAAKDTQEDDVVGVTQLVQALKILTNNGPNNKNIIKLPFFDGKSPVDWLMFKRAFQDTVGSFTVAENLARLNQALKGAAREAVSMLLVMAPHANDVIDALDRRFGRPEQIVLEEVSAIRALPKLGQEVRELINFATRVRNCVEITKLLHHSDYLRSPELFGVLVSKLSPLLRARWLDFAAIHESSNQTKVELLSCFLNREVDLVMKFGGVFDNTPFAPSSALPQRQRAHAITESGSAAAIPTKSSIQENSCLFCKNKHQLSSCQKFSTLTADDKWSFIKQNKVCHRCLQKVPHNFRFCNKNKTNCTISGCNRKHHVLLHNDNFVQSLHLTQVETKPTVSTSNNDHVVVASNNTTQASAFRPLLKMVAVTISGPAGSIDTFALLDDGSTATFIDAEIASQIGSVGPEGSFHLDCVGGLSRDGTVQYVDFEIKGRSASQKFLIQKAKSIKNLGLLSQSATRASLRPYPYLSNLIDELCYDEARPTILIGVDNWHLITASEIRRGSRSQPVAIKTPLGWVLFGFTSSRTSLVETTYHLSLHERNSPQHDLELLIKSQYKLDAIGITKHEPSSLDDQRALRILESTAQRLPNGRFQVGLLWKADNLVVPESYPLALSRFKSLELKMSKDFEYAQRYRLHIQDMIAKGYAEDCTGKSPLGLCWYLPHFGVVNPNKPGKLRVVHDAAAKVQGVSLNNMLLSGPDLLQSLLGILMRFREGKIALTADIKEMFPQVKIQESDRDAQRFLWRDNPTRPIKTYRMSSMIFGACSSPSTAIYIVNRSASEFQDEFPDAVKAIITDTYMDDYIGSVDLSTKGAARLAADIVEVHKRGGFEMRGWVSNKPEALCNLPTELLSDLSLSNSSVDLGSLGSLQSTFTRTLGLIWQPCHDVLGFNPGLKDYLPDHFTKREVLAQVMRIYDPLGILAPIVVRGRILFQNLWRKNLDWDEKLSQSDRATWLEWFESLKSIYELKIPRCYNLGSYSDLELHVFCDASELAHAAVAYWRFVLPNGDVKLALIASKARVSPLKPVSIPRLELQGALIATRLAAKICEAHRFKPNRRVFWCDSMTVLGWLRSDARNYKPFVAHRIGEILESTSVIDWHWVPTDLNVADDATRGKASIEPRWLSGPEFLITSPSEWPTEPTAAKPATLGQEELKPSLQLSPSSHATASVHFTESRQLPSPVVANITHFSSWIRLVRATARTHQFIAIIFKNRGHNFLNFWVRDICSSSSALERNSRLNITPATAPAPLDAQDIIRAERHILGRSQLNAFKEDLLCLTRGQPIQKKSRLATLSPILKEGLLHLAGRTSTISEKQPIILDGKELATRLLISHYHAKFAHANTETVINELRQEYWILGIRNAVRSVVHQCQLCKLLKGTPLQPPMANLPYARLAHDRRAFTYTGLDYFGPVTISIGRRREKRWIALFTCMVTRAIHLEIVASLSADSAIMCLRRFIARRGTPTEIFSDNGTSFVGANRQLRALYDTAVPQFAAEQKIAWRFIPPSAPFMGGVWERLVRSVKTALKVTLRERAPREEVLGTLLAEAEAIINSRPLTHVSPDRDYPEALTPNHFLLGDSTGLGRQLPAEDLTDAALVGRSSWRKALRLADHFWRRWVTEYLPTLAPRRVLGTDVAIKVGEPVLIGDGNLPRGTWPRGVIEALYPGRDGIVRVVDVRTQGGILRRPVKKLVLL